ncbi:hypothetical protein PC116_g11019 [Phytophthora cactorum]|uniref:Uncharacterized protein n=1 Tax=Phytophthora cactorum TaxID=29920 RepID=A0A8T1CW43_9STRA|nr:hypothetical protein Pcac1_g2501 [Phytophthora cactorum]KAG2832153.1 hypothetical protein PC111_g6723 [Phytophthora cactorum]KAG2835083.1 hypothetical protein PC112_g5836 [Phytophthora cactorum]KAG2860403.1 hypothetical protein PC113_g8083 [Phytophthora cactorum]KAG2929367.1 hypothetical protein PC115_g6866 [Phytophthora cactorum]
MQVTFQTSSTIVKREDKDAAHNSDKKSKNPSKDPRKDKKSVEKSPAKLSKHRSGKDQQRRLQSKNPFSSDPDSSDDSSSIEESSSSSDWKRGLEEELAPATASTSAASIAYRSEFCRNKGSPYDRYYELKPKKTESARSFLYHLNAAAKRADVDYEGSLSAQELHVRRFLKKLKDIDLRSTLQGQTFKSVRDLEKTLKRVEAVQQDDGYTTQPPKARDSKASGVRFSRFRRTVVTRVTKSAEEDSDAE